METELVLTDTEANTTDAVRRAVSHLQAGGVVALPTETVYGLAADALDAKAVESIFEAKGRPHFDPLIVHLPRKEAYAEVAQVPKEIAKPVVQLIETFWPGPLTLVLPKKPLIPDIVTGGLDTVAVRQSFHPIFHRIIRQFGRPLAAPSANLFGCLSPTSAQAVLDQLGGRIPLVVDGGACSRGLESTIVKILPGDPKPIIEILRPGPITVEDLKRFGKVRLATSNEAVASQSPEAPGMLENHYAPETPLILLDEPSKFHAEPGKKYALLSYRGQPKDGFVDLHEWDQVEVLSPGSGRVNEAGVRLFHLLRKLDQSGVDVIVSEPIPDRGVGTAIMDRLRKAALKAS